MTTTLSLSLQYRQRGRILPIGTAETPARRADNRHDRYQVFRVIGPHLVVEYIGYRIGTTTWGLPLGGPRWRPQTPLLAGRDGFATVTLHDPAPVDRADQVTAWHGAVCQAVIRRDPEHRDQWHITDSDAALPDGVERIVFESPNAALDHLAQHGGYTYQITI